MKKGVLILTTLFLLVIIGISVVSAAWDISELQETGITYNFSAENGQSQGVFFKPDGTKAYFAFHTEDSIYQYNLSTPWDLTTMVYSGENLYVNDEQQSVKEAWFKPDGIKLFVYGSGTPDWLQQYTCSDAWNISSCTYDTISCSTASKELSGDFMYMKDDGTILYFGGYMNGKVYQWTFGTPWDLTTCGNGGKTEFDISAQNDHPKAIHMSADGTKLFAVGMDYNLSEYTLGTPWAINTASHTRNVDTTSFTPSLTAPYGLYFNGSGNRMYISDRDSIWQFNFPPIPPPPLENATFENINVTNRGFFSYIGDSIFRVIKGWFTEVDAVNITTQNLQVNNKDVCLEDGTNCLADVDTEIKSGSFNADDGSTTVITFNTSFSSIPEVTASFATDNGASKDEIAIIQVNTNQVSIKIQKGHGGANDNWDIHWIATNAGNS